MAQQLINIGTVVNDDTGDPLRTAFDKDNDNFTELYALQSQTINAGSIDFVGAGSNENKISAAIAAADLVGALRVFVPEVMLPYDASLVTFGNAQLVREGGSYDVYDVRAYGATGDDAADDTDEIQACLDAVTALQDAAMLIAPVTIAAGAYSGTMPDVFFPQGKYRISEALIPPSYCNIRSENNARIIQLDPTKDIFYIDGGFRVRFFGMTFLGGRHVIYYRNDNISSGIMLAQLCEFHAQSDYSIRLGDLLGGGDCSSSIAHIVDCQFYRPKGVCRSVCDRTTFKHIWVHISASNFDADTAAFFNESGDMVFDEMFGIPEMNYGGPRVDAARWVDNYGSFYSTNSRFGGEDSGMAIVYHYAVPGADVSPFTNGPAIVIEGGYIAAGPGADPDTGIIHLIDHVPQLIAIRDVQGITDVPIIVNTGALNLSTYFTPYTNSESKFHFDIENNLTWGITPVIPVELRKYMKSDEDTWTPVLAGHSTPGTYELHADTSCYYEKRERKVTIFAHIVLAAAVTGGGAGNIRLTGLPFPIAAAPPYACSSSAVLTGIAFTGSQANVERVTSAETSTLFFYGLANTGVITEVPITAVGVNDTINFELSYITR